MKISDIKIRKITNQEKLKAIVSVTFDNELVVHDIKVIEGTDKLFISMPNRKNKNGGYNDIAHPINAEMREYLNEQILAEYLNEINKLNSERVKEDDKNDRK